MSKFISQFARRYDFEFLSNGLRYGNWWFAKQEVIKTAVKRIQTSR